MFSHKKNSIGRSRVYGAKVKKAPSGRYRFLKNLFRTTLWTQWSGTFPRIVWLLPWRILSKWVKRTRMLCAIFLLSQPSTFIVLTEDTICSGQIVTLCSFTEFTKWDHNDPLRSQFACTRTFLPMSRGATSSMASTSGDDSTQAHQLLAVYIHKVRCSVRLPHENTCLGLDHVRGFLFPKTTSILLNLFAFCFVEPGGDMDDPGKPN